MKKIYRIKDPQEFKKIILKNDTIINNIFVIKKNKILLDHFRVGISVPKKLGNAVIRNKIKRQIRMMVMDITKNNIIKKDFIIITKAQYLNNNYLNNYKSLEKLIKKL